MIEERIGQIASMIKTGKLPHRRILQRLFKAGVAQKRKMLKLPYRKRKARDADNPSTKVLLWIALLLEDVEGFRQIEKFVAKEEADGYAFQRDELNISRNERGPIVPTARIVALKVSELNGLSDDNDFQTVISEKIKKMCPNYIRELDMF